MAYEIPPLTVYLGAPCDVMQMIKTEKLDASGKLDIELVQRKLDEKRVLELEDVGRVPDTRLRIKRMWNLFVCLDGKRVVFAETPSFPFTHPDYRGKGIAAHVNFVRDVIGERRHASVYTIGGFKARLRTHEMHVQNAVSKGERLSDKVLEWYDVSEDGKVKQKPYSEEHHNIIRASEILARQQEDYESRKAKRIINLERFDPFKGPTKSHRYHKEFGFEVAKRIAKTFNGEVIVSSFEDEEGPFYQAKLGNLVMDAYGIRATDDAEQELRRIYNVPSQTKMTTEIVGNDHQYVKGWFDHFVKPEEMETTIRKIHKGLLKMGVTPKREDESPSFSL